MYWLGVREIRRRRGGGGGGGGGAPPSYLLSQWEAYAAAGGGEADVDAADALEALSQALGERGESELRGRTSMCIIPGYTFRLCDALVTNFHTPDSTLLLLVGALMGRQPIKEAYAHAVEANYRFLSYGDATLLVPPKK